MMAFAMLDHARRPAIGAAGGKFFHLFLLPTFRSSCSIAAPTFTNFEKPWALANLLILVPLYRSEVPDRIRRLWCRDFRSVGLAKGTGVNSAIEALPRGAQSGVAAVSGP